METVVENSGKIPLKVNKPAKKRVAPVLVAENQVGISKKTKYVSKFMQNPVPVKKHFKYFCIDTPLDLPEIEVFCTNLVNAGYSTDMVTSFRFEKVSRRQRNMDGTYSFFPRFHTEIRVRVTDDFDIQGFANSFFSDSHVEEFVV